MNQALLERLLFFLLILSFPFPGKVAILKTRCTQVNYSLSQRCKIFDFGELMFLTGINILVKPAVLKSRLLPHHHTETPGLGQGSLGPKDRRMFLHTLIYETDNSMAPLIVDSKKSAFVSIAWFRPYKSFFPQDSFRLFDTRETGSCIDGIMHPDFLSPHSMP